MKKNLLILFLFISVKCLAQIEELNFQVYSGGVFYKEEYYYNGFVKLDKVLDTPYTFIDYDLYRYPQRSYSIGPYMYVLQVEENISTLWRSDGTKNGTYPVHTAPNIDYISIGHLVGNEDRIYFLINNKELWTLDNGSMQAVKVATSNDEAGFEYPSLAVLNNTVYIAEQVKGKLWKLNNNALQLISSNFFIDGLFRTLNGSLYANIKDGVGQALYKIDVNGNISKIAPTNATFPATIFYLVNEGSSASVNNRIYFSINNYQELWETDGTAEGTKRLQSGEFTRLKATKNKLYSLMLNGDINVTDLTSGITERINFGWGYVDQAVVMDGKVYFIDTNKLWVSDGTYEGTKIIFHENDDYQGEINGDRSFHWFSISNLVAAYDAIYFVENEQIEVIDPETSHYSYSEAKYYRFKPEIEVLGSQYISTSEDITIYPNPVNDVFKLTIPNSLEKANIHITDAYGKVYAENIVVKNHSEIDLSTLGLDKGIYVLKVNSNNYNAAVKLVKK